MHKLWQHKCLKHGRTTSLCGINHYYSNGTYTGSFDGTHPMAGKQGPHGAMQFQHKLPRDIWAPPQSWLPQPKQATVQATSLITFCDMHCDAWRCSWNDELPRGAHFLVLGAPDALLRYICHTPADTMLPSNMAKAISQTLPTRSGSCSACLGLARSPCQWTASTRFERSHSNTLASPRTKNVDDATDLRIMVYKQRSPRKPL